MWMVTVSIWSKQLESRTPCPSYGENLESGIMETTVSMWQLTYSTHTCSHTWKGTPLLKCSFYHLAFVIIIFTSMIEFFPVCHAHGNSLHQDCCIVCGHERYVLAFRWGDTASVHASSWSPAPTAAVKFLLLLRGLDSNCASVYLCAGMCSSTCACWKRLAFNCLIHHNKLDCCFMYKKQPQKTK